MKCHTSLLETSLKSESRQEKLAFFSERGPSERTRGGVFLSVADFAFDEGRVGMTLIVKLTVVTQFYFLWWTGECEACEGSLLQSCSANEDHVYAGIQKVLIYFPFVPFRSFTPILLLSSSCCSCANRSCSVSAIRAPEPTNVPAIHGVLPCWGSALHELHSILPQVKQKRNQAGTNKEGSLQQMHKAHKRSLPC